MPAQPHASVRYTLKPISEMLASAKREWTMRQRVYPRWVEEGRMTFEKAMHEITCMESIVQFLEASLLLKEAGDEIIALEEKRQNEPKPEQSEMKL